MSYDLHLFRPAPGVDLLAAARESYEREGDEPDPEGADPYDVERKHALVAALRDENPALQPFEMDYAAIARSQGITVDEARSRYRHVELNGPDDGNGIQITLYEKTAAVTVPYWHSGAQAAPVLDEITRYLGVLEREGGYRTYDPQLERVLDLAAGPAEMLGSYATGMGHVAGIAAAGDAPPKPWWRIW